MTADRLCRRGREELLDSRRQLEARLVGEQRIVRGAGVDEELTPEIPAARPAGEVGVQPVEEARAQPRRWVVQAEPADYDLLEQVVSHEQLVRSFAREHDL